MSLPRVTINSPPPSSSSSSSSSPNPNLPQMNPGDPTSAPPQWARLSRDLEELILCYLPLPSLVRAAAVCTSWRRLISDPSFPTRTRNHLPWFFLFGQNNIFLKQNQAFGFDPLSNTWIRLPMNPTCFSGSGGLLFSAASATRFSYAPLLCGPHRPHHRTTSPLAFSRLNPLVGVFSETKKLIVVGGARFIGGLVDIEDRLAVEIYHPETDTWELGPPLPPEFRSGNSSQWLCSALLSDTMFFVFGIFTGMITSFDLGTKTWAEVKILRPVPGVLFSFLIACRDRLVLAGLCNMSIVIWEVDYKGMGFREIGAMPREMMMGLFESDDDDAKFASLKCVGLDGVVYVFSEDCHRGYPACVCEIGEDMVCRWRTVPPLPRPVNRFHKVIAFCSNVDLSSVLGGDRVIGG